MNKQTLNYWKWGLGPNATDHMYGSFGIFIWDKSKTQLKSDQGGNQSKYRKIIQKAEVKSKIQTPNRVRNSLTHKELYWQKTPEAQGNYWTQSRRIHDNLTRTKWCTQALKKQEGGDNGTNRRSTLMQRTGLIHRAGGKLGGHLKSGQGTRRKEPISLDMKIKTLKLNAEKKKKTQQKCLKT